LPIITVSTKLEESKIKVPPAPTVKLYPSIMVFEIHSPITGILPIMQDEGVVLLDTA